MRTDPTPDEVRIARMLLVQSGIPPACVEPNQPCEQCDQYEITDVRITAHETRITDRGQVRRLKAFPYNALGVNCELFVEAIRILDRKYGPKAMAPVAKVELFRQILSAAEQRFMGMQPVDPREDDRFRDYIQNGGCCCPYCGSHNVDGSSVEIEPYGARQSVSCLECNRDWTDVYQLTEVEEHNGDDESN